MVFMQKSNAKPANVEIRAFQITKMYKMQCGATAEIINEKKVLHKTLELEINAWYSKASSSKGKYNITELNWKRIRAETSSGEELDIEMQSGNLRVYPDRVLFYGGRLVNSSLQQGFKYDKMEKSIVVSIINGILFAELDSCHSIFDVRERQTGFLLGDRLDLWTGLLNIPVCLSKKLKDFRI